MGGANSPTERLPLVVVSEDDDELRELMCEVLEQDGFRTRTVRSLEEARQALGDDDCVLLLDLKIGAEDGERWLRELAAMNDLAPRTLIVSGSTGASALGAKYGVRVVKKPFDADALAEAVRDAARNGRRPATAQS